MGDNAIQAHGLGKRFLIGKQAPQRGLHQLYEDAIRAVVRKVTRRGDVNPGERDNVLWALRDINFKIRHGEIVGLIGHNGAGKTTLLKLILGLAKASAGQVRIWDTDPSDRAFSKYRPKQIGSGEATRSQNRRVEIYLIPSIPAGSPSPAPAPATESM